MYNTPYNREIKNKIFDIEKKYIGDLRDSGRLVDFNFIPSISDELAYEPNTMFHHNPTGSGRIGDDYIGFGHYNEEMDQIDGEGHIGAGKKKKSNKKGSKQYKKSGEGLFGDIGQAVGSIGDHLIGTGKEEEGGMTDINNFFNPQKMNGKGLFSDIGRTVGDLGDDIIGEGGAKKKRGRPKKNNTKSKPKEKSKGKPKKKSGEGLFGDIGQAVGSIGDHLIGTGEKTGGVGMSWSHNPYLDKLTAKEAPGMSDGSNYNVAAQLARGTRPAADDDPYKQYTGLIPQQQLKGVIQAGAKKNKPLTKWQKLLKKVMDEKKMTMKEAIKYVKKNNLY